MQVTAKENPSAKVYWRGVDISSPCFAADDSEGWADVFVCDGNGKRILGTLKDGKPTQDKFEDPEHQYDQQVLVARITSDDLKIIKEGSNG